MVAPFKGRLTELSY